MRMISHNVYTDSLLSVVFQRNILDDAATTIQTLSNWPNLNLFAVYK